MATLSKEGKEVTTPSSSSLSSSSSSSSLSSKEEKEKEMEMNEMYSNIPSSSSSPFLFLPEGEEIIMQKHSVFPFVSSLYKFETHLYITTTTTSTSTTTSNTNINPYNAFKTHRNLSSSYTSNYNYSSVQGDSGDSTDFLFDDYNLSPITDISMDGVVASLGFNIIVCVALILSYEVLRRLLPEVYAAKRTIRLIRKGKGRRWRERLERLVKRKRKRRQSSRSSSLMGKDDGKSEALMMHVPEEEEEEEEEHDYYEEDVEVEDLEDEKEWIVEHITDMAPTTIPPPPPPSPTRTRTTVTATSTNSSSQSLYNSSSLSINSSTSSIGYTEREANTNNNNLNNPNNNKSTTTTNNNNNNVPPTLPPSPIPLNWLVPIYGVSWKQLRYNAGLDAYMFLRFIRLCLRITAVSAFWSMAILAPVYASGGNGAQGFYLLSMANIPQHRSSSGSSSYADYNNNGNNDGDGGGGYNNKGATNNWRLWIPCVFIYLLSGFVFFVMKQEYRHYIELRMEFLGRGDVKGGKTTTSPSSLNPENVNPQHHYSLMVERIPLDLRSDTALFDYFDSLFPGKVHSACVVLNLPDLEALSSRRLRVVRRLEKSIAEFEATGIRPTHTVGRWRCMCCGVECIGASRGCSCCNIGKYHHEDDPTPIQKGEVVDSISYYTRDLAEMNHQVFVLQQSKLRVADSGKQSMRAERWFSKALNMTNEVLDDLLQECKQDEGLTLMMSSEDDDKEVWSSSSNEDNDDAGENDTEKEEEEEEELKQKEKEMLEEIQKQKERNTLERAKKWQQKERYCGYGGGESITKYGTIAKNLDGSSSLGDTPPPTPPPPPPPPPPSASLGTRKAASEPSSGDAAANSSVTTMQSPATTVTPTKDAREKSISWAPKHETHLVGDDNCRSSKSSTSDFDPRRDYDPARDDDPTRASVLSKSRPGFQDKSYRWPKRLIGRLGLDFVVAGVKYLNKQLDVAVESAVGATMSTVGFVTFFDLSSVTCSASTLLTHKPNALEVRVAPESRDIIWKNAHVDRNVLRGREFFANVLLALGAILWSIPLAMIQALATADSLARIPGMEWILTFDEGTLRAFINGYLPVLALLGLIVILPVVFQAVAIHYEGRKTLSEVQESIMGRYFYYQLANIYITVTAGSIWNSLADILDRPSAILEILGTKLPTVVGYFISLLITKILAGLPVIILRFGALSRMLFLKACFRERRLTQRELDEVYREENLLYGWEYPTQLLVIVICFTYAVISPIILPVGALYFFGALMVYKKQALYVYTPRYESGGLLFPTACDRTIFGLICGQITFIGYTVMREAYYQPIFLFPLPICSIWVMWYFRRHYAAPSKSLSLERAMELDHISDGKMSVARSPSSPKFSKGSRRDFEKRSKSMFCGDAYRQPVLAEKALEPLPYRRGMHDPVTEEAKSHLQGRYQRMTEAGNNPTRLIAGDISFGSSSCEGHSFEEPPTLV